MRMREDSMQRCSTDLRCGPMSLPTLLISSPKIWRLEIAILKFGSATSVMRKPTNCGSPETTAALSSTSFRVLCSESIAEARAFQFPISPKASVISLGTKPNTCFRWHADQEISNHIVQDSSELKFGRAIELSTHYIHQSRAHELFPEAIPERSIPFKINKRAHTQHRYAYSSIIDLTLIVTFPPLLFCLFLPYRRSLSISYLSSVKKVSWNRRSYMCTGGVGYGELIFSYLLICTICGFIHSAAGTYICDNVDNFSVILLQFTGHFLSR